MMFMARKSKRRVFAQSEDLPWCGRRLEEGRCAHARRLRSVRVRVIRKNLCLILLAGVLLSARTDAASWTLIQFGTNQASCVTPYGDWTNVIYDAARTTFVNPDGDPNHWGIVETGDIPEGQWAFYGVRGTTPIRLQRGHKLIATFFNRTDEYAFPVVRFSLSDTNAPNPLETNQFWFTMQTRRYRDNAEWVPPYTSFQLEYYIADEDRVCANGGPASTGTWFVVNLSKPYNDAHFVLNRIELSDEADLSPPGPPLNLQARLVATTADAGSNVVRLTWNPASDPAPNASGISRYLIFRQGELYDSVDEETTAFLGTNPFYLDLNVAPGTSYSYSVTALDGAFYGTYPVAGQMNHRVGNEGPAAGPVIITTGSWQSGLLIDPHGQLKYLGGFRLPAGMEEYWAESAGAMTFYPDGNPQANSTSELTGSLYLYTRQSEAIAEINIPKPVLSGDVLEWPRATVLRGPTNLWPVRYEVGGIPTSVPPGGTDYRVAGLAFHPGAGSVSARLYFGQCNFYSSEWSAPGHGWFDLDLTRGDGVWFIGAPYPENVYPGLVTRLAFQIPSNWAAQHTGGRTLGVGDTFLSGGQVIAHGPSLYAVAPWESGTLPGNGGSVTAVEMLRYSEATTLSNRVTNFRIDQTGQGAAWLEWGGRSAVAIAYRRTVGDLWYGDSLGNNDAYFDIPEPIMGDKGAGASRYKTGLMLYNPNDLAAVCHGTMASWEPQPYVVFDFDRFSLKPEGGDGYAGGLAYDPATGYLFFIEHNGDPEDGNRPVVHVWRLRSAATAPRLSAAFAGADLTLSWQTGNDGSTHRLQWAASLPATEWNDAEPAYAADGAIKVFTWRASADSPRFFRVRVQPP